MGPVEFGAKGITQREEYLLRAAELSARAQAESDAARKDEFENMARAYLRLAEQAKRNSLTGYRLDAAKKRAAIKPSAAVRNNGLSWQTFRVQLAFRTTACGSYSTHLPQSRT